MPKVKLPRKSTAVDMTAMCDVAFLLLSFFILATKTKPPEAVAVITPSSVSTKIAKENAILVTLTKEGKVYLMLGDKAKKQAILEDVNTTKALGLSPAELTKLRKMEFIGMPFNKIKSMLQLSEPLEPKKMEGIPVSYPIGPQPFLHREISPLCHLDTSRVQSLGALCLEHHLLVHHRPYRRLGK